MRSSLIAALAFTVSGAIGAAEQTPGVTAKTITIGGTFPLTGPAASYAPIPVGMKAYFAYVNARKGPDGKRGVMGRQIVWKYYDDGYNPANTAQLTRRLVEQDKVFATVGQLGTEPVLGARAYLNQQKVPQALVSTGASYWGTQWKEFPWTTGWQPDYIAEGRLYGLHIKANNRNKKIAIVYQNDDYGKDYLYGFLAALGKQYADAERRREGSRRDDGDVGRGPDDPRPGERRDDLRRVPAPDPDGPDDRDGQGARLQPRADLHELGRGDQAGDGRHGRSGRCAVRQRDHHDRLRQGPAGPEVEQRPGDEALPHDHREVRRWAEPPTTRRSTTASRRPRRSSRSLYKAGKNLTRARLMNALLSMNYPNKFLLPGVVQKTSSEGPLHRQPDAAPALQLDREAGSPFGKLIERPSALAAPADRVVT